MLTEGPLEGFNVRDRLGKESITLDDVREGLAEIRWSATTKPAGLLAGMPLVQRMASPTRFEPVTQSQRADALAPAPIVLYSFFVFLFFVIALCVRILTTHTRSSIRSSRTYNNCRSAP